MRLADVGFIRHREGRQQGAHAGPRFKHLGGDVFGIGQRSTIDGQLRMQWQWLTHVVASRAQRERVAEPCFISNRGDFVIGMPVARQRHLPLAVGEHVHRASGVHRQIDGKDPVVIPMNHLAPLNQIVAILLDPDNLYGEVALAPAHFEQQLAGRVRDVKYLDMAICRQPAMPIGNQLRTRLAQRIDQLFDKELAQIMIRRNGNLGQAAGCRGDIAEQHHKAIGRTDADGVDFAAQRQVQHSGDRRRINVGIAPARLVVNHQTTVIAQHHWIDVLHAVGKQHNIARPGSVHQTIDSGLQPPAHGRQVRRERRLGPHIVDHLIRMIAHGQQYVAGHVKFINLQIFEISYAKPVIGQCHATPELNENFDGIF